MTRIEQAATRLDLAIDRLIDGHDLRPAPDEEALVATARVLRRALPRLHPRFSFEEHLAARLAAAQHPQPRPASASEQPVSIASAREAIEPATPGPGEPEAAMAALRAAARRRRSLVASGAIASGVSLALPIAGAAIVVWRRSRSSGGLW